MLGFAQAKPRMDRGGGGGLAGPTLTTNQALGGGIWPALELLTPYFFKRFFSEYFFNKGRFYEAKRPPWDFSSVNFCSLNWKFFEWNSNTRPVFQYQDRCMVSVSFSALLIDRIPIANSPSLLSGLILVKIIPPYSTFSFAPCTKSTISSGQWNIVVYPASVRHLSISSFFPLICQQRRILTVPWPY